MPCRYLCPTPRYPFLRVVQISVSHSSVSFPPCRPGQRVHQTLTLSNYGDTPASFCFTNSGVLAPTITISPTQGVVPAGSHALVSFWVTGRGGVDRGREGQVCAAA